MKILVTGSSGHLGEALVRTLSLDPELEIIGLDIKASPYTTVVGSVSEERLVAECMKGVNLVYHTATLHKPHVATHSKQDFVCTNVSGTLTLLEAAVENGVPDFVFTSTTSVFGDALRPAAGKPAAWVTEDTQSVPKNIYGVTKTAAEELCRLFHRMYGLNCIILRASRFFAEEDDNPSKRQSYTDANIKANEYLYRRIELEDVVNAHIRAAERAIDIGFGRYIVSATTPFVPDDIVLLNTDAIEVVRRRLPKAFDILESLGWKMFDRIDRVYVNEAARLDLGWTPKYDFNHVLERHQNGQSSLSEIATAVGIKGYHDRLFSDGPYPVDE
ncbi:MAG: NAD-dependent epimerase/dehydratase family protein [Halioglobus sp.]